MDKDLTPTQAKALEILENRRFWTLLGAFAFILLAIGAGRYFMMESGRKQERLASDKLFKIERMEAEGTDPSTNLFSADFMKKRLAWDATKKEALKKELEALVAEFPSTASAQSARIRLGALAFQDSQFDQAIKYFDDTISHGSAVVSDIPYWGAKLGKGYVLESQKKNDEALKSYKEVSENLKNPLAAEAVLSQVRMLKTLGRTAEIHPLIEKVKAEFTGTNYEALIRSYETAR